MNVWDIVKGVLLALLIRDAWNSVVKLFITLATNWLEKHTRGEK